MNTNAGFRALRWTISISNLPSMRCAMPCTPYPPITTVNRSTAPGLGVSWERPAASTNRLWQDPDAGSHAGGCPGPVERQDGMVSGLRPTLDW